MVKYCSLWFCSLLRALVQNQEMLVGYENMVNLYKNMSYIGLGEQWDIQIYDEIEE